MSRWSPHLGTQSLYTFAKRLYWSFLVQRGWDFEDSPQTAHLEGINLQHCRKIDSFKITASKISNCHLTFAFVAFQCGRGLKNAFLIYFLHVVQDVAPRNLFGSSSNLAKVDQDIGVHRITTHLSSFSRRPYSHETVSVRVVDIRSRLGFLERENNGISICIVNQVNIQIWCSFIV